MDCAEFGPLVVGQYVQHIPSFKRSPVAKHLHSGRPTRLTKTSELENLWNEKVPKMDRIPARNKICFSELLNWRAIVVFGTLWSRWSRGSLCMSHIPGGVGNASRRPRDGLATGSRQSHNHKPLWRPFYRPSTGCQNCSFCGLHSDGRTDRHMCLSVLPSEQGTKRNRWSILVILSVCATTGRRPKSCWSGTFP